MPLPLVLGLLICLLSGCGDDDGSVAAGPELGSFSLTITDAGREVVMEGEARYKGADRFINNTLRHKIDLRGSNNDPDFIINVLIDGDDGHWITGSYPLARISPVSNVEPPVAEAYFFGSDTYRFVDNTGIVKINEITEEGVKGEFDVQIINDVTGNFASIQGTFHAENQ